MSGGVIDKPPTVVDKAETVIVDVGKKLTSVYDTVSKKLEELGDDASGATDSLATAAKFLPWLAIGAVGLYIYSWLPHSKVNR